MELSYSNCSYSNYVAPLLVLINTEGYTFVLGADKIHHASWKRPLDVKRPVAIAP